MQIKNRWTGEVIHELEGANLAETIRDAIEKRKVLSGADLSGADLSGADLRRADLSGANLRRADLSCADLSCADLSGANLSDANLRRADLSCANLSDANLRRADLSCANLIDANLSGANLSDAVLSDAKHLIHVPVIHNIHQSIAAAIQTEGCSLDMSVWHACKTTHCRAGWAITLAGEAGKVLESCVGPSVAGAMIYMASDPTLERVPNWVANDGEAMADILACAEREANAAKT